MRLVLTNTIAQLAGHASLVRALAFKAELRVSLKNIQRITRQDNRDLAEQRAQKAAGKPAD